MKTILHWLCYGWGGITIGVLAGAMISSGGNLLGISTQKLEITESAEEVQSIEVNSVNEDEEKPAKSEEKPVEKPAEFTPKAVEKPVEAVGKVIHENETSFYDYGDYEETILGTCPSERDKSNSWERGSRMAALRTEIDRAPWTRLTLNQYIESWWDTYRKGELPGNTYLGKYMMANLTQIEGFDKHWSNTRVAMYIDFDGFFVTWDNSWEDEKTININSEQLEYLDHLQSEGTLYLRSLEARYNAKCPND